MRLLGCLFFLMGCVPMVQYEKLEKNLSATKAQRDTLKKRIISCEETIKGLKEAQKIVPKTAINDAELEEIKKKAFEEAEKKYQERINRLGQ